MLIVKTPVIERYYGNEICGYQIGCGLFSIAKDTWLSYAKYIDEDTEYCNDDADRKINLYTLYHGATLVENPSLEIITFVKQYGDHEALHIIQDVVEKEIQKAEMPDTIRKIYVLQKLGKNYHNSELYLTGDPEADSLILQSQSYELYDEFPERTMFRKYSYQCKIQPYWYDSELFSRITSEPYLKIDDLKIFCSLEANKDATYKSLLFKILYKNVEVLATSTQIQNVIKNIDAHVFPKLHFKNVENATTELFKQAFTQRNCYYVLANSYADITELAGSDRQFFLELCSGIQIALEGELSKGVIVAMYEADAEDLEGICINSDKISETCNVLVFYEDYVDEIYDACYIV